jgi:hypothetical protein
VENGETDHSIGWNSSLVDTGAIVARTSIFARRGVGLSILRDSILSGYDFK